MIGWAIETLIASTILMGVVLAVRGPVARYFGPHIAYGLWLLPALRMLLPPLPEQVTPSPLHILPASVDIEALLMAPVPASAGPAEAAINWPIVLAVLWAAGALAFLAWHIQSYRRFVGEALGTATQLPRFDRDGVEVCASPAARGPFAAGIFMKTIVLPEDYRRRYERDELRLAIEHEIRHHQRCDMSANFAALVVLALHWWNPIAHFAHRAFRVDQELACDAMVLAGATPAERHAYGSALLKSACDRLPVAACALGAGDDLKRRLTMMKVYQWNPTRARVGSMIGASLVGAGLLLTASNGIAAETTKQVEEQVRTALAPVAPVPPAPLPPAAAPLPPAPAVKVERHVKQNGRVVTVVTREIDADDPGTEIDRAVREAQREAAADARAARSEAMAASREAVAQARASAAQAVAQARADMPRMHVVTRTCVNGHSTTIIDGRVIEQCGQVPGVDAAAIRAQVIASLEQTRSSIAASMDDDWVRHQREQALAGIDRQIARLKAAK